MLNYKILNEVLINFRVMKLKLLSIAILIMVSCAKNKKSDEALETALNNVEEVKDQDREINLEVYDYNGFEKFLNKKNDTIYVLNFWATWCAPCVKELPYFEAINEKYKAENVQVILVSLDFPHLYDTKLKPFIKDKNLKSKVIALDDPDSNAWIPELDKTWTGAIPATVIYKNNKRAFFEQSFTFEELETEIKPFLN